MLFGIEMEVTYRCVESEARQWSLVITPSRGVFASYHPYRCVESEAEEPLLESPP